MALRGAAKAAPRIASPEPDSGLRLIRQSQRNSETLDLVSPPHDRLHCSPRSEALRDLRGQLTCAAKPRAVERAYVFIANVSTLRRVDLATVDEAQSEKSVMRARGSRQIL